MNIWVISMWAIAAVLACVSFSLFVRWISEARARLRKHLVSQRSTRSFLLALALILLSASASLFAGLMAVHLEDLFTERNEQWTTPIALIAGGVVILGLFLIIMGSIGDRARGRTRCPKCWYDMRDAPKLQCPECGHTAQSTTQFTKPRRARWAIALGLVLVVAGAYPVAMNKKTIEYGPLAMMPTWVLMTWWQELPEEWIVYRRRVGQRSSLQSRIDHNLISDAKAQRFGASLIGPMLTSKQARWDPIRLDLLTTIYPPWLKKNATEKERARQAKPNIPNLNALLERLAFDQLEALTTTTPTEIDAVIIERATAFRFGAQVPLNTYELVRYWIVGEESRADTRNYGGIRVQLLKAPPVRKQLAGFVPTLKETDLSQALMSENKTTNTIAYRLITDTGTLGDYFDLFINAPIPQEYFSFSGSSFTKYTARITNSVIALPEESQRAYFQTLTRWLDDDNPRRVAMSIMVVDGLRRALKLDHTSEHEAYQQFVARVWNEKLDDQRSLYPSGTYKNQSVSMKAQRLILKHLNDPTGEVTFPLIQEWLTAYGYAYWTKGLYKDPPEPTITRWLEHFESFADSPNPQSRKWIASNLPHASGTEYEDRINQILLKLASDPNTEVAKDAERAIRIRNITHLLPN